MTEIPQAVLSEHFALHMNGRRLLAAIFTTFRFEPSFFETEVLPVFLDVSLSHASAIKLVQLEEALGADKAISVYYDQHGLVAEGGPAKLDIRRIPIRHRTGVFHPKNVFALVEQVEADEKGQHPRTLLCACSSANLTRAGWWENVEVAHVEEVAQGASTTLRDSLLDYLNALDRAASVPARTSPSSEVGASQQIRTFLEGATQHRPRSEERLLTRFHDGRLSVPDFIDGIAGSALRGFCLEVISPYLDGGPVSAPLEALLARFEPREVRVFLPRNDRREAVCSEELFTWVAAHKEVAWGELSGDLLALGNGADARQRTVHAKVYRFFEPRRGGREILYVGSANLTTAGCRMAGSGGNWETGFLVEVKSERPGWWLQAKVQKPAAFAPREEEEGTATSGGTKLVLRFHWGTHAAAAFWHHESSSPALLVRKDGVQLFELSELAPLVWTPLSAEAARALEQALVSTSLLEVQGEGPEPGMLLVQEEGMSHRPSLLLDLSTADILRYWALLTVEQRTAFIESRAQLGGDDDPLRAQLMPLPAASSLFDRFAGAFHAFQCLEDRVREALHQGKTREAEYRLFGNKYDSLGTLLERIAEESKAGTGDAVEQYVNTLCARQLMTELGRAFPPYWSQHAEDVRRLESALADADGARAAIEGSSAGMPDFMAWFEDWFLKPAAALAEEQP